MSKAPDAAWCWKKPKAVPDGDYPLHYQVVQLERAVIAEVIAGANNSGVFEELGSIGTQLAKQADDHAYVIGSVRFEERDLPANLHVGTDPYEAAVKAFDAGSSARVYFIAVRIDGYVEGGDGNDGLRATVEIHGVFGDRTISRNYGRTNHYCVTSAADGKLVLATRAGARG